MRFLIIFFFATCVFNIGLVKGQSQQVVALTKSISNTPFEESYVGTAKIENLNVYTIPIHFKDYIVKSLSLDNKYGTTKFKLLGGQERNFISFLININPDSSRTVICDLNNNLDFSDDKVIIYPRNKDNSELNEYFSIPLKYGSLSTNYFVQPEIYSSGLKYSRMDEQTHYLVIKSYEKYSGLISVNGKDYLIYLKNRSGRPYFYKNDLEVRYESSKSLFKSCTSQDVITIDGQKILVDSISIDGSKLFLKYFDPNKAFRQHGFLEEFVLDPIKIIDINNDALSIPGSQQYTLLDFWGTWCAPCKELTPQLVALHQKYQSIVSFISLANSSKRSDVVKYAAATKINWPQVVEDKLNSKLFGDNMFSVTAFPTFILIDKSGKILFRLTGSEGLKKIASFLDHR